MVTTSSICFPFTHSVAERRVMSPSETQYWSFYLQGTDKLEILIPCEITWKQSSLKQEILQETQLPNIG